MPSARRPPTTFLPGFDNEPAHSGAYGQHVTAVQQSNGHTNGHSAINGHPPATHVSRLEAERGTGEKSKARDILAAIRTLKSIEAHHRQATTDERDILSRFGGFGPVALSIFPDPVTGQYKPGWQAIGDELKALLTPEEYDSAKRTTFTAFYTSPVVMTAMHDTLSRLGVSDTATILEPGCGKGAFLASGTPISNSMVELYTIQRFLDPEGLRSRGIEHFDAWAASFGEVVDTMEISPDGASLRPRSRFAKFVNLPELMQMFHAFADILTPEELNLSRPALEGGKPQIVACPMSEEQAELQAGLVKRYERIRSEKVDPREDNALAITTDGRKLALDARMLSGAAPDFPASKINALVDNVVRIWHKTEAKRGTQMVFCDMGVNPTSWGFSAYDEVVDKLIEHGIPRHQIAIMGDADTDAKKQALFEKVRQGTVRVLIGSTQKMGTGTNVQKRLVALHHLDAPWKPAEVEQREGRILRQGNSNEEVAIYRYVTEGSFDAFMWQALETKARFIAQIMSGDCAVRKAEDIGSQELSYAEVKAIASGNPAILTLAETDAELQRLAILKKNHTDEQYVARRSVRDLPATIKRLEDRVQGLTSDMATLKAHAGDRLIIGDHPLDDKDAQVLLGKRLNSLPAEVSETRTVRLGAYRGLEFGVVIHKFGAPEIYLQGEAIRHGMLAKDAGPRAVINALDRLADGYDGQLVKETRELGIARDQLRDYQGRIDKPFAHAEYASQLADLRDRLRLGLSDKAPESGTPVAEIAEMIKALRASNTVEAAPERTGARKAVRAQRPVTTIIKERLDVQEQQESAGQSEICRPIENVQVEQKSAGHAGDAGAPPPVIPAIVLTEPQKPRPIDSMPVNGYRQAVTRRRQGGEEQMRLF